MRKKAHRHRGIGRQRAQRNDVIKHVEATPVGCDHEIVAVDGDVAHRARRESAAQRLPIIAIIERNEEVPLGPGEEQPPLHGIFADHVHRVGPALPGESVRDLGPGAASVPSPQDVRPLVFEPVPIDRRVGNIRVEMRRLDNADLRPRLKRSRCHVYPMRAGVVRAPHQPVVGADPDQSVADRRRADIVDDSAARALDPRVPDRRRVQVRRHTGIGPRQIGTDRSPGLAAIRSAEQTLIAEVERVIALAEGQWQRPCTAIFAWKGEGWIKAAHLPGLAVQPLDATAIDDVGIVRIRRDLIALAAGSDLVKLVHRDPVEPAVAAAVDRRGARILLRSIDPVREAVVGRDVVELTGRLVVPAAPGLAAIDRDQRTLVDSENPPIRAFRVDPQGVEIVARRIALDRNEVRAAVVRTEHDGVLDPDLIGVLRVCRDPAEVPPALPDALVAAHLAPRRARIVGTVETTLVRLTAVDQRIDAMGIGRARRESNPPRRARQPMPGELMPRAAAVDRLVEPAAGPVRGRIGVPWRPPSLPQRGINDVGIARLEREVDRPSVGVLEKRLGPGLAAISRAEDAALLVRPVRMAQSGYEYDVRVARIDEDLRDLLRIGKSDRLPARAAVARPEHTDALRDVGAHVGLAGADVDRLRRRRRDGDGSDRADVRLVEDRCPGAARVARAPHAAVDRAEIEAPRIVGRARHREHSPAAERPDRAPVEILEQRRVDRSALRRRRRDHEGKCQKQLGSNAHFGTFGIGEIRACLEQRGLALKLHRLRPT